MVADGLYQKSAKRRRGRRLIRSDFTVLRDLSQRPCTRARDALSLSLSLTPQKEHPGGTLVCIKISRSGTNRGRGTVWHGNFIWRTQPHREPPRRPNWALQANGNHGRGKEEATKEARQGQREPKGPKRLKVRSGKSEGTAGASAARPTLTRGLVYGTPQNVGVERRCLREERRKSRNLWWKAVSRKSYSHL